MKLCEVPFLILRRTGEGLVEPRHAQALFEERGRAADAVLQRPRERERLAQSARQRQRPPIPRSSDDVR